MVSLNPQAKAGAPGPTPAQLGINAETIKADMTAASPFATKAGGALEAEAYIKFIMIVEKHSILSFKPHRNTLQTKRIEALKAKNMKEYGMIINEAGMLHSKVVFEVRKIAAVTINLSKASYEYSMQEAQENAETMAALKEQTTAQRLALDLDESEEALTQEKAKEIILEKIALEFAGEKRLANLPPMQKDPRMIQTMFLMERTKSADEISIKFGTNA